MKTFAIFLVLLLGFSALSTAQNTNVKKYHRLSGKLALTLEGGGTYSLTDFRDEEISFFGRLLGEYFFPTTQVGAWGLRGHAGGGYLEGLGGASGTRPELENFKTPVFFLGGGGQYIVTVSEIFMPYVYAGTSYLFFDPRDNDNNRLARNNTKRYSRHEWMLIGELGFRFLASDNVSVNLGINVNYIDMDNLDDITIGSDNDIFFTGFGGISIYFGGTTDSDGDGLNDKDDLCPNTPRDVIVDEFGCPVDVDSDGIPDYLDKCPNTPANIPVNSSGCAVDSDGDRIPDYLDLCKDTPEGIEVDKRGCPFDEDQDGVPDFRDECENTPIGIEVNRWGCPPESLKEELPEITSLVLSAGVNFNVGESTLLPAAMTELNNIVVVMKDHPDTRWNIEGHTDNSGSYSLNKRLSYDRADAVADYLVLRGIDRIRLDIHGYGPDYPVADNSTAYGRSLNRRVAIELVEDKIDIKTERVEITEITTGEYNTALERHLGNMIFSDGNLYCFQVSSFRTRLRAEQDAEKYRRQGANVFIVEANLPELDGTWYRVRIGYFNTLTEARENRTRFME